MPTEKKKGNYCRLKWEYNANSKIPKINFEGECDQSINQYLEDQQHYPDVSNDFEILQASKWFQMHPDDSPTRIVIEKRETKDPHEFVVHRHALLKNGMIGSYGGDFYLDLEDAIKAYKERLNFESRGLFR